MNENIFTIGFALFIALIIVWSGSFVVTGQNVFITKLGLFIFGWFSYGWLMLSLYLVWLGLLLPRELR